MEAKIDADRHRQEQMFQWMQNLSAKMGEPLPQALFHPPRPPKDTPVSTSTIPFFLYLLVQNSPAGCVRKQIRISTYNSSQKKNHHPKWCVHGKGRSVDVVVTT